ncbi:MAG: ribosomal protein S18-alanine N-acetyltransferase [Nitrososphaerales archaeon]|nr:ribosomal protein S18-alanine N-acetyltransferase [Nitrososphaerales archaeon]
MQKVIIKRIGEYVIRRCVKDDLEQVISINLTTLPEHYSTYFYEELLEDAPEAFIVAEIDNQIVGYVMGRIEFGFSNIKFGFAKKGHIVSIAVLEGHRRKGLGSALMEEAIKGFAQRGCKEVFLEVRVSNIPAIRLYEKLGFVITARHEGYYNDGEAAYQMSLPIPNG